jgi:hypothetical protein
MSKDEVIVWLESLTIKQLIALRSQCGLKPQPGNSLEARRVSLIERLRSNAILIDVYEATYGKEA